MKKYIVLHQQGAQWLNKVGNSLHVPFIDADSIEQAVNMAVTKAGEAPMYLVMSLNGCSVVSPESKLRVEPFVEPEPFGG
jgi:hypothetical protein